MEKRILEQELRVLFDVSRVIGEALNLQQALESVLAIISETLAMQRATVTLLDEETGDLAIQASHGLTTEEIKRGVYRQDEGVTGRIFKTAQPFYVPDISREPLFLNKTQSRELDKGRVAFVGVPILLSGSPIGVLNVDRLFGKEVSTDEDIRFLTIVAQLIGQFVSLNQQVKQREGLLRRQNKLLKAEVSRRYNDFFIVGQSRPMRQVQGLMAKVAPSNASVLLLGESGTGKTLVARIIHEMSGRAEGPFVKINCAALPETLLESELFGHAKGAFTGATESKAGRFEEAEGGTIFLDEIAEMPLGLQAKLLRFLQDREFERLGSTRTLRVDVRIIAATNRDLTTLVEEKSFRQDLYYRLNVFPVRIPALRERPEDIGPLIHHFLDKYSLEFSRDYRLGKGVEEVLAAYPWPGNVRELENMLQRLAIMAEGEVITKNTLPEFLWSSSEQPPPIHSENGGGSRLAELEKEEMIQALKRNRWVQSRAANELGITLRQFGYRLKKYDMQSLVKSQRRSLLDRS